MSNLKLTDEQIEAAAKAMRESHDVIDGRTDFYGSMARAAAPFLQAPWEMPIGQEVHLLCDAVARKVSSSNGGIHPETLLREFVSRRNAALLPKPVDPSRERIIVALLYGTDGARAIAEKLVDRILAALDEQEAAHG